MREVEAKYLVDRPVKHRIGTLLAALEENGFRIKSSETTKQTDIYLDTPASHLHSAGWSYRIRSRFNGADDEHTLKRLKPGVGGLFQRTEITQSCTTAHGVPPGPVTNEISQLLPDDTSVQPLFKQTTRRRNYRIKHPNFPSSRAVLSVDRVRIQNSSCKYAEIEAELVRGDPRFVLGIASLISRLEGYVPARMSKYDRARFCLDTSQDLAPESDSNCSQTWQQRGIEYLAKQLGEIERCEPYAWEGVHPEGVHQMRVATRRMRSALKWFSNALPADHVRTLRKDLRALTRRLGTIRDLDVHIADLVDAPAYYRMRLEEDRQAARRDFIDLIKQGRLRRLQADFDTLLADLEPCDVSIAESLRTRFIPALSAAVSLGSNVRLYDPKDLHQLRLAIKDLKYGLETVPGLLPAVGATVEKLQDVLGKHQDAQVALERVSRERGKRMKRLQHGYSERAEKARRKLNKPWRKFVRAVDALQASSNLS